MRTSLFILIFIIMVGCKKETNYEIAVEFFNKGEYNKASIYLNIIDSNDVDFQNAKIITT
ncbi:hypothetical protein [Flavobacterium sp. N3904]|uniref:hypothetical protein n=1 Tax=Flavobacterium sp. N3904 TaxID=2986835 RepID=UPI002224E883|nr:hypothetical protein [Flavobacterium sp. N3904]